MNHQDLITLTLVQGSSSTYNVHWSSNNVELGRIYCEVDGEYVFVPSDADHGGYWTADSLHAIAQHLDRLSQPNRDQINAYFDEQGDS